MSDYKLCKIMQAMQSKQQQETSATQAAANRSVETSSNQPMALEDNRSSAVMQQKQVAAMQSRETVQKQNKTGLPDHLKSGIEDMSGHSLDDIKVHYNSSKPAQLNAHAYAQGKTIHLASGQEKHLPHEAWHIVQQKQGRVKPTKKVDGANINDDAGLEKEADIMGAKALQRKPKTKQKETAQLQSSSTVIQKKDMHYWVVKPGEKHYIGSFKSHAAANAWWAENKSSYVGYTFGQGSSATKYR